jgi:hypothetical protein
MSKLLIKFNLMKSSDNWVKKSGFNKFAVHWVVELE